MNGRFGSRLSFPAGVSAVESTWVVCYDWCLRWTAVGDRLWLDAKRGLAGKVAVTGGHCNYTALGLVFSIVSIKDCAERDSGAPAAVPAGSGEPRTDDYWWSMAAILLPSLILRVVEVGLLVDHYGGDGLGLGPPGSRISGRHFHAGFELADGDGGAGGEQHLGARDAGFLAGRARFGRVLDRAAGAFFCGKVPIRSPA